MKRPRSVWPNGHARTVRLGVILLLGISSISGQTPSVSTTNGNTPPSTAPGTPAGSYALSGFESVNLFSGRLNFHLPLIQVAGRGESGYSIGIGIDRHWKIENRLDAYGNRTGYYHAISDLDSFTPAVSNPFAPGRMVARRSVSGVQTCSGFVNPTSYQATLTRLVFTAADGTETEFVDAATGGAALWPSECPQAAASTWGPVNRRRRFEARDGSGSIFIASDDVYDYPFFDSNFESQNISGEMITRAGLRYQIDTGRVTAITDRNGNRTDLAYDSTYINWLTSVTDSTGRPITFSSGPETQQIHFRGSDGTDRRITVTYEELSNDLLAREVNPELELQTRTDLFGTYGGDDSLLFTPKVVESISLPNGQTYRFRYNEFAELAQVRLPTGGEYRYTWSGGVDYNGGYPFVYRFVTQREVYPDSNTCEGRTTYLREAAGTTMLFGATPYPLTKVTVTHETCEGSPLKQTAHYFFGDARNADPEEKNDIPYSLWQKGREYRTDALEADGTILKSTEQTWEQRPCLAPEQCLPGRQADPRVTSVQITLPATNEVTETTYGYDRFNNRTEISEYDYGTGAKGALLRRTKTDFVTINPVNQIDYTSDTRRLISLPAKEQVYDGNNTLAAQSEYAYDCYSTLCSSAAAALTGRDNIVQHATGYDASFIARGNPTSIARYIDASTKSVTAHQYDTAGNATKIIDARGNATEYSLADDFSAGAPSNGSAFAYVTEVRNALGHTVRTKWNYWIGQPEEISDANGQKTTLDYSDLLNRLKTVSLPVGSVTHEYQDAAPASVATTRTLDSCQSGNSIVSTATYDGLGRLSQTATQEDSGWIRVDRRYDASGRPHSISDPYRGTPSAWTETAFDALDRPLIVTTRADGAAVRHFHRGSSSWTRDQAGKWKQVRQDALGRIRRVVEDPNVSEADGLGDTNTAGANLITEYGYGATAELVKVCQGGGLQPDGECEEGAQPRTFTYDMLGRLKTAWNPESGMTTYDYDPAGNLTFRQDARGSQAHLQYDALNRVASKTYSAGSHTAATPAVRYCYDGVATGLCADAPKEADPDAPVLNLKGRLTMVASSAGKTSYSRYDANGQILRSEQDGFRFRYTYNPAGLPETVTYPSGRAVTTCYDAAGRAKVVKDGNGEQYASVESGADPETGSDVLEGFAPTGLVQRLRLGANMIEARTFNNRWQPARVFAGVWNSGAAVYSPRLKLAYGYPAATNNGNVQNQIITATSDAASMTFTQTYEYDALNRLKTTTESGGWMETEDYDDWGNRSTARSPVLPNPPVPTGSNLFPRTGVNGAPSNRVNGGVYDAGGNLREHGMWTLTWDAENRLGQGDGGSSGSWLHVYDGDGRRVRRVTCPTLSGCTEQTAGAQRRTYVYDAFGNLAAEYDGEATGAGVQYLTVDALGSTRLVTDASGEVVDRVDYLPFGEEIPASVNGRGSIDGYGAAQSTTLRFTGKERDAATGLDYFGARYFSAAQGRFTSPDAPLADQWEKDPQSWNLYTYARNNPLKYTDPTGRACVYDNGKPVGDDGAGGGCKEAGVDPNGRIQPHGATVNAQGGNRLVAFGLNLLFALDSAASSYFRPLTDAMGVRPSYMEQVPVTREFIGQAATATVAIGTALMGPGGGQAPLKLIHAPETLSKTILEGLRKKTTQELVESLKPGLEEALRVKPDGRVMNGNHRITVLTERGVDVNSLPREVVK